MSCLYFGESIQDQGDFIIGTLVISTDGLLNKVHKPWGDMRLDTKLFEYKSFHLKSSDPAGIKHREMRLTFKSEELGQRLRAAETQLLLAYIGEILQEVEIEDYRGRAVGSTGSLRPQEEAEGLILQITIYLRATVRDIRVTGNILKVSGGNKMLTQFVAANVPVHPPTSHASLWDVLWDELTSKQTYH